MARAAVLREFEGPLEIAEIEVPAPRAGEVRVRIAASGVCHSDVNVIEKKFPSFPLPVVLGHEGAGIVQAVGEGVENVAEGDHVILSAIPRCGTCFWCRTGQFTLCDKSANMMQGGGLDGTPRLLLDGQPLHQFCFSGTFSEETVVPALNVCAVDRAMPLDVASLIGCGVLTGFGASRMVELRGDQSVVVVGCGGVGLNVIQGLRRQSPGQLIAVDVVPYKLELARQFGATAVVNASESDALAAVQELTEGRGADVGFEVIGKGPTMQQMVNMVRRGGECIFVGLGLTELQTATFVPLAKTLRGCLYGMADFERDFPLLVSSYLAGELMLDELVTRRIALDEVNEAFEAMEHGEVARSVIVFDR